MVTTSTTNMALSEAYAATSAAEKALITALDEAITAFVAAIDTATDGMPTDAPQNAALAFANRLKANTFFTYELTTLKGQYGLLPAMVTPAMPVITTPA